MVVDSAGGYSCRWGGVEWGEVGRGVSSCMGKHSGEPSICRGQTTVRLPEIFHTNVVPINMQFSQS